MRVRKIDVDRGVTFGNGTLTFIAGPCVIESRKMALDLAERLMRTGAIHGLVFHCTPLVDTDLEAVKMCKDWIRRHGEDRWGVQASLRNSGR